MPTDVGEQPRLTQQPRPESTELLPTRFFVRRRAIRVLGIWGCLVVTLFATTCGVLVPVWMRARRTRANNACLIAESQPLAELRQKSWLMDQENERRAKWNEWVESAKPDDSLLQTLAAVAEATNTVETGIEIDSLEIQLPLEYPAKVKQPPRWAAPQLLITAKVSDGSSTRTWLQRLNASDRIEDATSRLVPGSGGTVGVNARPVATRCLP